MRHSKLALILIRLNIESEPHLLQIRHRKWSDWTLVGGHVEPDENNDWARAAVRECNEELTPLCFGTDFTLLPLLDRPVHWGPVPSKSVGGKLTMYTAQLFILRFLKPPVECLSRLADTEFRIVKEADLRPSASLPDSALDITNRMLGSVDNRVLAWDAVLPTHPSLGASSGY